MELKEEQELYKENGYFIKNNFLDLNIINRLNKLVDSSKPVSHIPYSENIPWGYGNLFDNEVYTKLINLEGKKNYLSNFLFEGKTVCNLLMIVNKAPFIGPDVEWHQEFLNINTYAPGYDPKEDLDKFLNHLYNSLPKEQFDRIKYAVVQSGTGLDLSTIGVSAGNKIVVKNV